MQFLVSAKKDLKKKKKHLIAFNLPTPTYNEMGMM